MNLLMIDSAADFEILTLYKNGICFDGSSYTNMGHSRMMFTEIEKLFNDAMITPADLDAVCAGIGPGSFTGIRLAVSAARALAQVNGIPLLTAPTHLLYSLKYKDRIGSIVVSALDAKKGRVFGAAYLITADAPGITQIVAPGDYRMEDLCAMLPADKEVIAVGDGCGRYLSEMTNALSKVHFDRDFIPDGKAAAEYFKALFESGVRPSYNEALPLYTRKSDAEVLNDLRKKEADI